MASDSATSRYVRVLHASLGHPKHIGLSAGQRGTWLAALVLADIAYPEPIHEAAVRAHCQDADFEELYKRQLLERNGHGEGWFTVHDLRQFHVAPSSTPEAVAARKRKSRMSQKSQKSQVSRKSRQTRRDEVPVTTTSSQDERDDESFSGVGRPSPARVDEPGRTA